MLLQVYPPDQLQSLMGESDFVVMALPGTPATKHFVGKAAIDAMKPTGVLINIGRGATLDTTALRSGEAQPACLSVTLSIQTLQGRCLAIIGLCVVSARIGWGSC